MSRVQEMIRWILQFAVLFWLLSAQSADAFTISPMSLTFVPSGGTETIKVKNPSDEPVEMMLRVFSWADSVNLSSLEVTDDLIAVPPIFKIPAKGEQTVRIALRRPLEINKEKAYRVLIGEIPSQTTRLQEVGLYLTVNLPIFVRPEDAKATPVWTIEEDGPAGLQLVLANEGRSYLKIRKIGLFGDDSETAPLFEASGGYVLAGDNRHWPLDDSLASLKRPITVRAESNIGPIESVISLPES